MKTITTHGTTADCPTPTKTGCPGYEGHEISQEEARGLLDALQNLTDAARLISERWESGDLADAVRTLETDRSFAEAAIAKAAPDES